MRRRIVAGVMVCLLTGFGPAFVPAQACGCGAVLAPGYYLPDVTALGTGYTITSESMRDREELAVTFADPEDAAIRLDAWGWGGQASRRYTDGARSMEISVHLFGTPEGASLALRWFAQQRADALGLHWDQPPPADQTVAGPVNYQVITGFTAASADYTLYGQRGPLLVRVSVTAPIGESDPGASVAMVGLATRSMGLVFQ